MNICISCGLPHAGEFQGCDACLAKDEAHDRGYQYSYEAFEELQERVTTWTQMPLPPWDELYVEYPRAY